jgi:hypothetical protein
MRLRSWSLCACSAASSASSRSASRCAQLVCSYLQCFILYCSNGKASVQVEAITAASSKIGALQALRAAARWPLDNDVLPELYLSLLQCLLREQVRLFVALLVIRPPFMHFHLPMHRLVCKLCTSCGTAAPRRCQSPSACSRASAAAGPAASAPPPGPRCCPATQHGCIPGLRRKTCWCTFRRWQWLSCYACSHLQVAPISWR